MYLGLPGKILSIAGDDPQMRSAKVSFGGIVKQVSLVYVPDAKVGDYTIVDVDCAISVVDEEEAAIALANLNKTIGVSKVKQS